MPELLLEILSEEIPARMQARAAEDLKRLVGEKLREAGLSAGRIESYATPRRLALVAVDVPKTQPDVREERRGPRTDAPAQAIEGFLRSTAVTLDKCEKRKTDKGEFWFAVIERIGKTSENVLPLKAFEAITQVAWPKSMRWASNRLSWVRPIQSVIAIYGGKPLEGVLRLGREGIAPTLGGFVSTEVMLAPPGDEFFENHVAFSDSTVGHRFLKPNRFKVRSFSDYKKKLRAAKVILDPVERRQVILDKAQKLAAAKGLTLVPDDALVDEVVGLVEWPVPLLGAIDAQFMDLPAEVLTTAMRRHQKYFALRDGKGALAPHFVFVANTETKDKGKAVVAGNERVLRARLSDARFFWDQDRRVRLESRVPKLGERVFHAKLGTDLERTGRLRRLAAELAAHIPGGDPVLAERAAYLCKADLSSGMVGEFPELQGLMGRYYAANDGEPPEVAAAIAEHYSPLGPSDACPKAPISIAVALADKIDMLVGFFAIGEKPTGSKDPFALRRAALGIIRLIVENGLRLPLAQIFDVADAHFAKAGAPQGGLPLNELLDFFADRLKVALKDKGVRHDLIDAVFAGGKAGGGREDDLVRLLARVDALERLLRSEDGANLLVAYRRAANILRIEEKKDATSYSGSADPTLLAQKQEAALHAALAEATPQIQEALARERFDDAMKTLARLRAPVDAFFDKVTVNCDDRALRANRLRLLSAIRSGLGGVADFSRIEG